MEDAPTTPTLAPPTATTPASSRPTHAAATAIAPPPPMPPFPPAAQPERDSRRSGNIGASGGGGSGGATGGRLGLTKEVLSAHTQQEEQAFLDRFKDLSKLRVFDQTASSTVRCHTPAGNTLSRGS